MPMVLAAANLVSRFGGASTAISVYHPRADSINEIKQRNLAIALQSVECPPRKYSSQSIQLAPVIQLVALETVQRVAASRAIFNCIGLAICFFSIFVARIRNQK